MRLTGQWWNVIWFLEVVKRQALHYGKVIFVAVGGMAWGRRDWAQGNQELVLSESMRALLALTLPKFLFCCL